MRRPSSVARPMDLPTELGRRAPGVLFKDEVAARLRCSERQIDKLEKLGLFPIPRLPSIDKRPRYSAKLVEQYENGELQVLRPSGRRGGSTR